MKRSEMIDTLAYEINDCFDGVLDFSLAKSLAAVVLTTAENNGMVKCEKRDLGEIGIMWTPEGWEEE